MSRPSPEIRPAPGRLPGAVPHHAREDVPYALRISAAWAWRVGLVVVVAGLLIWLLSYVSLLIIPLMVAALLSALLSPVVRFLSKAKVPRGLAVAITIIGFLGLIGGALSLVGRQLVVGFGALWDQVLEGLVQIQTWLTEGPLHLTTAQLNDYLTEGLRQLQNNSSAIFSSALTVGSTASHLLAGMLLTIFTLIFFLFDGGRIWSFLVRLLPRKARTPADGAGRRGWTSMVQYIRVQMFVAFIDALGIGIGAAIIGVPLALPLGVLVFLGSFIPIVGALVTGFIAVVLALVANGWVNALIMLAIVLGVQQLEGHVLQPLIMGKAVSLHPLAVVLAVAGGSMVAGIPGALFSVPVLAMVNAAVRYIAARAWETDPVLLQPPDAAARARERDQAAAAAAAGPAAGPQPATSPETAPATRPADTDDAADAQQRRGTH
ncbi:AI-2E family transporter [Arthrobacter sp. I2-34]|uniref:AI-2E family transporter n=1 Tax=Arthrobacter hankyongi TaxID=2904801 RepID=A0ABS9L1W0_9MICC|nr:AI-2E family transporter [Arthrobacter hankyongi]MCG2620623.1 AI-2E family transporter [Arthrobacter hankyongi]